MLRPEGGPAACLHTSKVHGSDHLHELPRRAVMLEAAGMRSSIFLPDAM